MPYRLMNNLRRLVTHNWRALLLAIFSGAFSIAFAASVPDVAGTRHNLSASNVLTAPGGSSFGTTVKATSETQICVFCHTPHGATSGGAIVAPLWNRSLNTLSTYTFYNSASMDASPLPGQNATLPGVGVGSKLCLSCHDGTLAIGTVGVLNNAPGNIGMLGTDTGGVMPPGTAGASTGYTRRLGIDLSNDHPISFTYDAAQAARDAELYNPGDAGVAVASRVRGQPSPQFPLVGPLGGQGSQVECITCHDPHLNDTSANNKFLRGNRLQVTNNQIDGTFDPAKDIMCLACHTKPGWGASAHSNSSVAAEQYNSASASLRDFPASTTVWQSACLACHDVHTVPGSRRLLREATDSAVTPKSGGNSAIEQACYQCHSPLGTTIVTPNTQVPDIRTDFATDTPTHYRMPIITAEQGDVPDGGGATGNAVERHDIGASAVSATDTAFGTSNIGRGKDMLETRTQLGAGDLVNRHAECPDCHQPHRLTKTHLFNDDPTAGATSGTHNHTSPHNNLASGVLRGAFGVEPGYSSNSFYAEPTSFVEKRGPVPIGAPTPIGSDTSATYLTREYQVCAKCHSSYSFGPLIGSIANPANIPSLGRTGGTPDKTNGMRFYTDVFREIQAPVAHQGNAVTIDSGAFAGVPPYTVLTPAVNFRTNNRRSWHPVMGPTGRTPALRNANATNWLAPWTNDVGNLTMYCTDCHGSNTTGAVSHQATDGPPEGPHGSTNIFLLKGWWDQCTGENINVANCLASSLTVSLSSPANTAVRPNNVTTNDLCFKCHSYNVYAGGAAGNSGFGGTGFGEGNLHAHHNSFFPDLNMRCMWCHVAVPHGWKNKAFLVNLNDVGPEATCRQEDADDVPVGYKCTEAGNAGLGNPMRLGTQVRNQGAFGSSNPAGPATTNGDWENVGYTNPPYYRNAILKIASFAASGNWSVANCSTVGTPGTDSNFGCGNWMGSNEGCSSPP